MSTSPIEVRPLARTVLVTDDTLTVGLADGRVITVPLVWFPRLLRASSSASKWELLGDGEGIHWPEADEDLSVEGLLAGTRGRGPA
jgi:hypothetical protein